MFFNVILNINAKIIFAKKIKQPQWLPYFLELVLPTREVYWFPETLCLIQKHFTCKSCSFSRWNRFETDGDISRSDSIWRNTSAAWRYIENYCPFRLTVNNKNFSKTNFIGKQLVVTFFYYLVVIYLKWRSALFIPQMP